MARLLIRANGAVNEDIPIIGRSCLMAPSQISSPESGPEGLVDFLMCLWLKEAENGLKEIKAEK